MINIHELLAYPRLKICQSEDCFRFSVDSLLIGDFVNIPAKTSKILDLCTGNAPIPVFLSLKTKAKIYAVEILEDAYNLGLASIEMNNLTDQITIVHGDLKDKNLFKGYSFDVITCNPPFFRLEESSNLSPVDNIAKARFEIDCTFDDICQTVNRLLKHGGFFTFIHTPERLSEIIHILSKYKLEVKRLRFVHAKSSSQARHVLIETKKTGQKSFLKVLSPLFLQEENGETTLEAKSIYNYGK